MPLLSINRNLPPVQLRLFGVVLMAVASVVAWKMGGFATPARAACWLLPLAVTVLPGFLHLPWMRGLYLAVSWVTFPLGFVLSYVILGLAFYGVISVAGVVMRALGRDPLNRRWEAAAATYWRKKVGGRTPSSYFKQY
ncbi:hypothetical protein [Nibricoccus sp. IMCC34717]|uniref:hypothetical protein n=1 Tax=Nibricoccus sp. IMCC34717 TaxID=3034021 RepID=UPI00384A51C2